VADRLEHCIPVGRMVIVGETCGCFVVGLGIRSVRIRDLMPLGAVWTVEGGTQAFDPTTCIST